MRPFLKILQYNDQDVFSPYMKICQLLGSFRKTWENSCFSACRKDQKNYFYGVCKRSNSEVSSQSRFLEAKMLCVYMKLQTRPCTHFRMAPFKYTTSLYKEETSWSTNVKIDKNNTRCPQYRGYISCYWLIAGLNCIS